MSFRSDDDAHEERVRSLEKQVEESRREVVDLRTKALRLEVAEKENKRLVAELARTRPGGGDPSKPRSSRRGPALVLVALIGVLVAGLTAALVMIDVAAPGPSAQSADEVMRIAALRQREELAFERAQQLDAQEVQLAAREAAIGARESAPVRPAAPVPFAERAIAFTPIVRDARVEQVRGDAPVRRRARCHVTIAPGTGDCRATVTCGDASLYPRSGDGGYFSCVVADGVLVSGDDTNPTPISGDPTLALDAAARTITITDTEPDWSALVVYDAN